MHLFQRRPSAPRPRPSAPCPGGRCCLAPQSLLFFGDDRREPVAWRLVIAWSLVGDLVQVLPATTQKKGGFYLVGRGGCTRSHDRDKERDSYVCPRAEVVPRAGLREVGVLQGNIWVNLIHWMREREERR